MVDIGWVSQTRFQARHSHVGPRLALLNIVSLMFVALPPFTSPVIGLVFLLMLRHAVSHALMPPGWRAERLGQRTLINLSVFALMIALAFMAHALALFVPFMLLMAHPLLPRSRRPGWGEMLRMSKHLTPALLDCGACTPTAAPITSTSCWSASRRASA
ncbi:hypothetical protein [Deinococcus marmoris]|uniref:hypothetical protein n=1 Tax=Deinococcus marmoris TaxID=249408 RepID=UPI00158B0F75|nr:hypothetical protein [Deinococcus marmoris]